MAESMVLASVSAQIDGVHRVEVSMTLDREHIRKGLVDMVNTVVGLVGRMEE